MDWDTGARRQILAEIEGHRRRLTHRAQQQVFYPTAAAVLVLCALLVHWRGPGAWSTNEAAILAISLVACLFAALIGARLRGGPDQAQVAAQLDRQLRLEDRLTTVTTAARETPLTAFLVSDTAIRLSPDAVAAIRPRAIVWQIWCLVPAVAIALLTAVWVPGPEPLGGPTVIDAQRHTVAAPILPLPEHGQPPMKPSPAAADRPLAPPATSAPPLAGRPTRHLPAVNKRRRTVAGTFVPQGRTAQDSSAAGKGGTLAALDTEPSPLFSDHPEQLVVPNQTFALGLGAGAAGEGGGKPTTGARRPAGRTSAPWRYPDLTLRRRQAVDEAVWRARVPFEYREILRRFFAEPQPK